MGGLVAGRSRTHRFRRVLLAGVASLVSLGFALSVGEALVRVIAPQDLKPTLFEYDALVGHRLRSNATARHRTKHREFDVRVSTNSHGWRSDELEDRPRILLLGDSFTFGVGVARRQTYAAVLQDSLRANQFLHQVINMGVEGRTPDQYWADYHHTKHLTQPDLLIVGFYERNDFITGSRLVSFSAHGAPTFHPLPRRSGAYAALRAAIQGPVYDWLAEHSHLATLSKNVLFALVADDDGSDELTRDPDATYTFKILSALNDEAAADGVPTIIAIFPASPRLPESPSSARTSRLIEQLTAADIPVLDLREEIGRREDFYYHVDDVHWNARGHARVAELLYDFLRQNQLPARRLVSPEKNAVVGVTG